MTDSTTSTPAGSSPAGVPGEQYLVVAEGGEPIGMVDMGRIDTEAIRLAFELAACCDDPAAMDQVQQATLDRVGTREFGYVCAGALRALAEHLLSPTLDAAAAAGVDLRPGLRKLASGRDPNGGGS